MDSEVKRYRIKVPAENSVFGEGSFFSLWQVPAASDGAREQHPPLPTAEGQTILPSISFTRFFCEAEPL